MASNKFRAVRGLVTAVCRERFQLRFRIRIVSLLSWGMTVLPFGISINSRGCCPVCCRIFLMAPPTRLKSVSLQGAPQSESICESQRRWGASPPMMRQGRVKEGNVLSKGAVGSVSSIPKVLPWPKRLFRVNSPLSERVIFWTIASPRPDPTT